LSYNVYQFKSFVELLRFIDSQINEMTNQVNTLSQRYNLLKKKAERIKKLEQALEQLVGEKVSSLNEIDFMGLKVVVSARTVDELKVLEETIVSLRDILSALQRVREVISKLASALGSSNEPGFVVLVQTLNNIPIRILLKESE